MTVPGRVLVIDDVPTEVDKVIDWLRAQGENVLFAPSMPENETFFENVRLLIIDLYLVANDQEASYEAVVSILERLSKRTAFFIIAIWSKYARNAEEDQRIVTELKNLFRERTGSDLKAVFLEPFGKSISQIELYERIKKSMDSRPECGLLLELERAIENARDGVVSDIVTTADVPVILKALKEEIGDVALGRQIVQLFMKLLSRRSNPTEAMRKCITALIALSSCIDTSKYGHIHSLQSYYEVSEDELLWTGDVLQRTDNRDIYALVVSPACDFAQRKLSHIKIIPAIRIDHEELTGTESLDRIKTKLGIDMPPKACAKAILTGSYLPSRFYVLKYLKARENDIFFHLVLDFQQVTSMQFKATGTSLSEAGWKRICRVDTPLIDNLLQSYSVYSSRIGVQGIPKDVIDSTLEKIGND